MKTNKTIRLIISTIALMLSVPSVHASGHMPSGKDEMLKVMSRVADWQIENFNQKRKIQFWGNATLYNGMADFAELYQLSYRDEKYWNWLYDIGYKVRFQMGDRMFHADDQAVGLVYIDLYEHFGKKPEMLWATQCRLDWIMENLEETSLDFRKKNAYTQNRWCWVDALYMAAPSFARMYSITGNDSYLEFMDKEFKATYDLLFDHEENLFFRDSRYFDRLEANGTEVFWGRGNGWAIGAITEILKLLPDDSEYRPFYEDIFKKMCHRLKELQVADGAWHASLLDPDSYPAPEMSATGFIVYAMAYGVNSGLLEAGVYLPAIQKGWNAMIDAVHEDGKLGFVQPVGSDPKEVTRDMTAVYGVGSFLCAGTEIYKLLD